VIAKNSNGPLRTPIKFTFVQVIKHRADPSRIGKWEASYLDGVPHGEIGQAANGQPEVFVFERQADGRLACFVTVWIAGAYDHTELKGLVARLPEFYATAEAALKAKHAGAEVIAE
jgi:hypothetical protein